MVNFVPEVDYSTIPEISNIRYGCYTSNSEVILFSFNKKNYIAEFNYYQYPYVLTGDIDIDKIVAFKFILNGIAKEIQC